MKICGGYCVNRFMVKDIALSIFLRAKLTHKTHYYDIMAVVWAYCCTYEL